MHLELVVHKNKKERKNVARLLDEPVISFGRTTNKNKKRLRQRIPACFTLWYCANAATVVCIVTPRVSALQNGTGENVFHATVL